MKTRSYPDLVFAIIVLYASAVPLASMGVLFACIAGTPGGTLVEDYIRAATYLGTAFAFVVAAGLLRLAMNVANGR